MDLLQNIRIISIPRWVKFVVAALLLAISCFNVFVVATGIIEEEFRDWAIAGAYLLGVVLPIVIIAILLGFSHSGVSALQKRTEEFLLSAIPTHLSQIAEEGGPFYATPAKSTYSVECARRAKVETNLRSERCYCDYRILAPDIVDADHDDQEVSTYREILIRVELNVRKVNFNLYVPETFIEEEVIKNCTTALDDEELSSRVLDFFGHSTAGAAGISEPSLANDYIHYKFNSKLLRRRIKGGSYLCLVASANLKPDFLWDPGERLYFCQDIMFMVRAFYSEFPQVFPRTTD